ncbi:MAG: hypothetical protein GOV00_02905 [Candidatus Altiarchaeota archaeon]|nr:hypothetical protein [Candidatus Altiarchaeota archaeon]
MEQHKSKEDCCGKGHEGHGHGAHGHRGNCNSEKFVRIKSLELAIHACDGDSSKLIELAKAIEEYIRNG